MAPYSLDLRKPRVRRHTGCARLSLHRELKSDRPVATPRDDECATCEFVSRHFCRLAM